MMGLVLPFRCTAQEKPGNSSTYSRRYLENVPAIVPLLEREFRFASAKLTSTQVGVCADDSCSTGACTGKVLVASSFCTVARHVLLDSVKQKICKARRTAAMQGELADLAPVRLKERGRVFREAFLSRLALLLRGTVSAPPDQFGETLADEHIRGGVSPAPSTTPSSTT